MPRPIRAAFPEAGRCADISTSSSSRKRGPSAFARASREALGSRVRGNDDSLCELYAWPMKLWSILGNSQRLDGGAMFGNAPRAMWEKWIAPDDGNRIPLACRCLLVEGLNGRNVLFETGIGAFFEPKLRERYGVVEARHVLLDSLTAAGFSHEDIDAVVLSHLHFD